MHPLPSAVAQVVAEVDSAETVVHVMARVAIVVARVLLRQPAHLHLHLLLRQPTHRHLPKHQQPLRLSRFQLTQNENETFPADKLTWQPYQEE